MYSYIGTMSRQHQSNRVNMPNRDFKYGYGKMTIDETMVNAIEYV